MEKKRLNMIQVGDVILSLDCLRECFCCDLDACRGKCCVEGDAGAPVTMDEVSAIEDILPDIEDDLSPEAREVIKRQGVAYIDPEGELVTSIVGGRDCVFTCFDENSCCRCAIECAREDGRIETEKPISCSLYPLRVKKFSNGLFGLNYHRWDICQAAVERGCKLGMPVYRFLREPLIKRFGEEWYEELEQVTESLRQQGYLD